MKTAALVRSTTTIGLGGQSIRSGALAASSRLRQISAQLHPRHTTYTLNSAIEATKLAESATRSYSSSAMAASSIPKTMKGVLIEKTGGIEVLQYKTDLPVPTPKEGEVLVKNDLLGINYIDTYFRTGLYPTQMPHILGREAESVIVTPSTAAPGFKAGDKVVWMSTSAYAEYTAVPVNELYHIPASIPRGIAAAALLQGLTTITLIDEAHNVKAGDWVLVHAAAGGVGQWLVQTLAARGAKTIATASTPEKRELAKKLGANVVTGYGRDEVLAAVKQHTPGGQGVIAVFDGVGKDTFDLSLDALARKGTLASFGNASGPADPLVIARLGGKNVKVCRPRLFGYLETAEERERYSKELWELIEAKKINVGIHETYPLSEVARAHTDLESRKTTGKLLLDPSK